MPGAGRRRGITRGQLKRWMQALGIVYLLMFLPVSSYIKEDILSVYGEAGSGQEEEDDGEQVSRQNGPGRAVALTFDDGPDSETTPLLLEGLRDRNVRATFFLIGENIEKDNNRDIVEKMHEDGHIIGNHTYHHVDLSALNREDAHRELAVTDNLIREITGEEVLFVRPPFGAFPDELSEELDKLYVKWTVDPLDWTTDNTEEIVRRVVTDVQENDIILLHDCYMSSVEAAFQIIDILQAEGYEFVTADRLLIE